MSVILVVMGLLAGVTLLLGSEQHLNLALLKAQQDNLMRYRESYLAAVNLSNLAIYIVATRPARFPARWCGHWQ